MTEKVDEAGSAERSQLSPSSREQVAREALRELDPMTKFFYTPHTLTALLAAAALLAFYADVFAPIPESSAPLDSSEPQAGTAANAKAGLTGAVLVFLVYSACQGPETQMIRPHPVFWRLVHGIAVLYLLALVWLLFQGLDDARLSLQHLYPELGVDLGERAYGADCRVFTPELPNKMANVWATIFDEFVLAHTFGWIAEALVLRHYGMLFTVSVAFELMELTFQHWLPNFNECWWDSWILDVAICNNIGIFLGMWLVKRYRGRKYHWAGISAQESVAGKVARGLGQLLPYYFNDLQWNWAAGPSRLVACLVCCVMNLQFKVIAFFLKFILWVPPTNPLNTYRLIIWFLIGLPATLEYYEFIGGGRGARIGFFAWLTLAISIVEILICIKFGRQVFTAPWPRVVVMSWAAAGLLFSALMALWCFMRYRQCGHRRAEKRE